MQTVAVDATYITLKSHEDTDDNWEETERRSNELHHALAQLTEVDRSLVHFYYFENFSVEEISKISDISISNVKTKLFRIRKKLHKKLNNKIKIELSSN